MILKVKSTAVNIGTGGSASAVSDASLVSVINTGIGASKVTINETVTKEVWIAAGERVVIAKDPTATIEASVSANVYASAIAYSVS